MFSSIGNGRGIGGALRHAVPGESFIRHIGNDKLIFDFHEGSGTTVHDKSHNGNDGTFGAGAAAPTWKRNSLYFDGGDYVDLTGIAHGISTGEFTLCFSVNNLLAGDIILDQETVRVNYTNSIGKMYIFYNVTDFFLTDVGIDSILPLSVQTTRDNSGNLECYVNGEIGGKGLSDAFNVNYDGISAVALGARYSFDSGFYLGTMYSFRILNKGLSGIECQQEYLANKFSNN